MKNNNPQNYIPEASPCMIYTPLLAFCTTMKYFRKLLRKFWERYINYLRKLTIRAHQTKFTCQRIRYQVKLMSFNVSFNLHIKDSFHISIEIGLPIPWFYVSLVKSYHYDAFTGICNMYISDKILCDDTVFI